jgi:hypothetical protein
VQRADRQLREKKRTLNGQCTPFAGILKHFMMIGVMAFEAFAKSTSSLASCLGERSGVSANVGNEVLKLTV